MAIKIIVFPRDPNHHQELIEKGIKKNFDIKIKYIDKLHPQDMSFLTFPFTLLWLKLLRYRIFHL